MLVTPPIHSLVREDQTREARVDAAPEHVHTESAQTTENAEIHAQQDTVMILAHVSEMRIHIIEISTAEVLGVHSQRLTAAIATSALQHLVWDAMMDAQRLARVCAPNPAHPDSVVWEALMEHFASTSRQQDLRLARLQLFTSDQSPTAMCTAEEVACPE